MPIDDAHGYGLCHCGCGQLTTIPTRSDKAKGWIKGQPLLWVRGHRHHRTPPTPYRIAPGVFAIPLTGVHASGRVSIVDEVDVDLVKDHCWYLHQALRFGRRDSGPYAMNERVGGMHNHLLGRRCIDHINGDGLDNRRCNLRPATPHLNNRNQRGSINGSSRYKGVFWFKRDSRWAAQIKIDGRSTHIGYFDNEDDAARAYDAAALEAWGSDANLNFGGWS